MIPSEVLIAQTRSRLRADEEKIVEDIRRPGEPFLARHDRRTILHAHHIRELGLGAHLIEQALEAVKRRLRVHDLRRDGGARRLHMSPGRSGLRARIHGRPARDAVQRRTRMPGSALVSLAHHFCPSDTCFPDTRTPPLASRTSGSQKLHPAPRFPARSPGEQPRVRERPRQKRGVVERDDQPDVVVVDELVALGHLHPHGRGHVEVVVHAVGIEREVGRVDDEVVAIEAPDRVTRW